MEQLTEGEVNDLRKSLMTLGLSEEEIEAQIEKAVKKSGDDQPTIEEQAAGGEEKPSGEGGDKGEEDEEIIKGKYQKLKKEIEEIEKAHPELKGEGSEIQKSLEDDIFKSIREEFGDSLTKGIEDVRKSISEEIISLKASLEEKDEIIKSIKEEVKKIGDTPIGMKSVFTKANFFEKSLGGDDFEEPEGSKQLSLSRDRDELIKSMQEELGSEKDPDIKQMLEEGISDFTVNKVPNSHGSRAIAYISRKRNYTIER